MGRIRSTHPGQWTDEHFVECSPLARLLAIAVRNECDDRGVFEWKPRSLKMKLLPADNCDIDAIFDELLLHKQVIKFDEGGTSYGAVRNFTKYQRPKKPKYRFPMPPGFRDQSVNGTEPAEDGGDEITEDGEVVPKRIPTASEIRPQRKEEGGRKNPIGKVTTLSQNSEKGDAAKLNERSATDDFDEVDE